MIHPANDRAVKTSYVSVAPLRHKQMKSSEIPVNKRSITEGKNGALSLHDLFRSPRIFEIMWMGNSGPGTYMMNI